MISRLKKLVLGLIFISGVPGYVGDSPGHNIILVNNTGIKISRVIIGQKTYEETSSREDKIFVSVTPAIHHMEIVFRGGVHVDWEKFDFANTTQITFELEGNQVTAHSK